MASINLGKVIFTLEGDYNSGVTYDRLTAVRHNGALWGSKQEVTGIEPTDANSAYWMKLSIDGYTNFEFFAGDWDATTTYEPMTIVRHDGMVWGNNLESTGEEPSELTDAWTKLLIDGEISLDYFNGRVEPLEDKFNNSFHADPQKYYGNVKTIDDFQDVSEWGSGSADTTNVKIGRQSFKITQTSNAEGNIKSSQNISLNLTNLNNGKESGDTDYITCVVYISDATKLSAVSVRFGQDAPYSITNAKVKDVTTGLVTGWNYLKLEKSSFLTYGTGSWDNIQSIQLIITSTDNASGEYGSFQLLQLVKKDPLADYPNPFQYNGEREFEINSGEWFVGEEFGKVVWKELGTANTSAGLKAVKQYQNCIIQYEGILDSGNDLPIITFGDDPQLGYIHIINNNIVLNNSEEGISKSLSTSVGDKIRVVALINNNKILVKVFVNESYMVMSSNTIDIPSSFAALIGRREYESYHKFSITEIAHAHHSDIAEVAKGLTEQAYCKIKQDTAQSIPVSTNTEIVFDEIISDNREHFDIVDNELVIRETGLYVIKSSVSMSSSANKLAIFLQKNGVGISGGYQTFAGVSGSSYYNLSIIEKLEKDDIISTNFFHDDSVARDTLPNHTTLQIAKIG